MEKTGDWPVNCSNTLAALVNLSPDSPTQMLTHNLRMRNVLMTFLDLSLGSRFSFFFFSTLAPLAGTLAGALAAPSLAFFTLEAWSNHQKKRRKQIRISKIIRLVKWSPPPLASSACVFRFHHHVLVSSRWSEISPDDDRQSTHTLLNLSQRARGWRGSVETNVE